MEDTCFPVLFKLFENGLVFIVFDKGKSLLPLFSFAMVQSFIKTLSDSSFPLLTKAQHKGPSA